MLDQFGNEIGGPSLEQRVKDLEVGFGEIVKAVVKLQQVVGVLLNDFHARQQERSGGSASEGDTTNGICKQPSQQSKSANEEQRPTETRSASEDGSAAG